MDPFSGAPMTYELVNNGYRLLSVGMDGMRAPAQNSRGDDVVWEVSK